MLIKCLTYLLRIAFQMGGLQPLTIYKRELQESSIAYDIYMIIMPAYNWLQSDHKNYEQLTGTCNMAMKLNRKCNCPQYDIQDCQSLQSNTIGLQQLRTGYKQVYCKQLIAFSASAAISAGFCWCMDHLPWMFFQVFSPVFLWCLIRGFNETLVCNSLMYDPSLRDFQLGFPCVSRVFFSILETSLEG